MSEAARPNDAALEASGVWKRYRRGRWALADVSLRVPAGQITALVGPNAAGKSTLIKTWVGFERPTRGTVIVEGIDPSRDRATALARIGYVPSNPFRYAGAYLDTATGLYQMGARYYQPATGRFTQSDPHPRSLTTVNRYAYARCNPTNYSDPTGLHESDVHTCLHAIEGAAILAGVAAADILIALALVGVSVTVGGISLGVGTPLSLAGIFGALLMVGVAVGAATGATLLIYHGCLGG